MTKVADKDRGFIADYNPQHKTKILLLQVQKILREYSDELPLTLRQIFYRLVAQFDFEKTEAGYTRLLNAMAKARRAGFISFDDIRDDGFYQSPENSVRDTENVLDYFDQIADTLRVDRQFGQAQKIIVWCEARGMVPSIETLASVYSVPVLSSGGFDSITAKRNFGGEIADLHRLGKSVTVLHIGDYDPSGETMYKALWEDVWCFAEGTSRGCNPKFTRLALTPEQIETFNLPSAPAKKSTHSKGFVGEAVQLEALDPRQLREIVKTEILRLTDESIYQQQIQREKDIRAEVKARLAGE